MDMTEILGPVDHGDACVGWEEANAANADGAAVMQAERDSGEAELEARVTTLVKEWPRAVRAAMNAVNHAQAVLADLHDCDPEVFDTADGAEARNVLLEARLKLNRAASIADKRLKLAEDAELRAEVERLRAENAELRGRLTGVPAGREG